MCGGGGGGVEAGINPPARQAIGSMAMCRPGGGAEVPCNQSQADASIRGATQELRSAQAAVALKLRQALSDQAPIEVLWPLTDEALTLLRTATLLRKVSWLVYH